jgi:hypothetical protein
VAYQFVQGIDYGPRKGTLGLSLHMSEGGDGLVGFLARHPGETLTQWKQRVNGVSCHAAILSTGKVVQMLNWGSSSGNLNPDDRAQEYGYYGHHHLEDVLGDHWVDPNAWTISAELAGFRATGPTDAQVKATISWGNQMKAMFPSIRGATGHHDQSPKPCPGLTTNMKAIFTGLGGHGLWESDSMAQTTITPVLEVGVGVVTAAAPVTVWLPDGTNKQNITLTDFPADAIEVRITQTDGRAPHGVFRRLAARPNAGYYVAASVVTFTGPPPATDITHKVTLSVDGQVAHEVTV